MGREGPVHTNDTVAPCGGIRLYWRWRTAGPARDLIDYSVGRFDLGEPGRRVGAPAKHYPVEQLPAMLLTAGFDQIDTNDLRPRIQLVRAHKPG